MLETKRFGSRARQPKSFTCIKFHLARTRCEVLRRKTGFFFFFVLFFVVFVATGNHVHVQLCVVSLIEKNSGACVIYNCINNAFPQCGMAL